MVLGASKIEAIFLFLILRVAIFKRRWRGGDLNYGGFV